MVFQTQAGNCSRAFAMFSNENKFLQTVEIFEPRVRKLDVRKFEIRNKYGTKIFQITVLYVIISCFRSIDYASVTINTEAPP